MLSFYPVRLAQQLASIIGTELVLGNKKYRKRTKEQNCRSSNSSNDLFHQILHSQKFTLVTTHTQLNVISLDSTIMVMGNHILKTYKHPPPLALTYVALALKHPWTAQLFVFHNNVT